MVLIQTELENTFGFWSALLIFKLLAMVALENTQQLIGKIFVHVDDSRSKPALETVLSSPDIERLHRNYLNDLENIIPWFILTYIYLTTQPPVWLAENLIRTFALSRIIHFLSYSIFAAQPARAVSFFIGYSIMLYQALSIMVHYI